ncbi:MAG TPA: endonuclease [Rhodobiaceae bacterium]|nr:endonuclease [Rhodobiaceae bacterium]
MADKPSRAGHKTPSPKSKVPKSKAPKSKAHKSKLIEPTPNYVYLIVTCDTGTTRSYVGWTTDLEKRLAAHNAGAGAKSTRGRQWRLVHSEVFKTRGEAMAREYALKKDRKARRALMSGAKFDSGPD